MIALRTCTLALLALSTTASAQRTRAVPRPLYPYPLYGIAPLDLETADLDGDGFVDLAAGEYAAGRVDVLTNRLPETGQFAGSTYYLPDSGNVDVDVEELAIGDLDGDGSLDIVIEVMHEYEVRYYLLYVYFNRGNGSFAPPDSYLVSTVGPSLDGLVCADVDLDRDLDVVTQMGSNLRVYANQGDGTLAAPVQQAGDCDRVDTTGDLDQDGDADLVTTDDFPACVKVFLSPGDGSFSTSTSYPIAGTTRHVKHADLDADGDLDIATSGGSVLRNLGDGTFAPAMKHDVVSIEGNDLTIADVDGDGLPELVVADGDTWVGGSDPSGLAILPNLGSADFGPPALLALPFAPWRVTSADFDQDGDVDLLPAGIHFDLGGRLMLNRGDGTFPAPEHQGPGPASSSLTSADEDGDGDVDLVTSGAASLSVYWNEGNASFPTRVDVAVPAEALPRPVTSVDLDGDGDKDLVTPNSSVDSVAIVSNLGGGSFSPYVSFATGDRPVAVAAGDLDDDGLVDLATADRNAGTASLLRNSGSSFEPPVSYAVGSGEPLSLTVADLDEDGDLDLAVARKTGTSTYSVAVLLNSGDGTLGTPAMFLAYGANALLGVDLDGDGDVDLLSNPVSVLTNHGDATFDTSVRYYTSSRDLSCADLDEDGDPDVAVDLSLGVTLLANRGDGTLRRLAVYANPGQGVTSADLDGDGDMDLARANDGVSVMRNQLRKPR